MRQQPEIPMPGQMSSSNNNNFPSYPSSSSRIPAYRPQQQPPLHLQQQQQMQQFGTGSHSQRATSVANSLHSQMGPRSYQQVSSSTYFFHQTTLYNVDSNTARQECPFFLDTLTLNEVFGKIYNYI